MSTSIWKTLSAIDCSAHVEQKGKFDYLAWTWAWAMVKEHYPLARYELLDDTVYPDGTMEVRVSVTIPMLHEIVEGQPIAEHALSHTMWLPVLNYQNKPIANPNAFDINTARMRCLVKCLAMFGLGHYIYAGESVPQESPEVVQEVAQEVIDKHLDILATGTAAEYYLFDRGLTDEQRDACFNSAPQGEKTKFKQRCRDRLKEAITLRDEYRHQLSELANNEDPAAVQLISELDPAEKRVVWDSLTDIEKAQLKAIQERVA